MLTDLNYINLEPYSIAEDSFTQRLQYNQLPSVTYPSIVSCLLLNLSPYTANDIKACIILEA